MQIPDLGENQHWTIFNTNPTTNLLVTGASKFPLWLKQVDSISDACTKGILIYTPGKSQKFTPGTERGLPFPDGIWIEGGVDSGSSGGR